MKVGDRVYMELVYRSLGGSQTWTRRRYGTVVKVNSKTRVVEWDNGKTEKVHFTALNRVREEP